MKKVFIIILGIFILFIIALITIPVFFKSDILRLIEEQSSKYMKADLKIGDVNLSMFKNFPDLSVHVIREPGNGKRHLNSYS